MAQCRRNTQIDSDSMKKYSYGRQTIGPEDIKSVVDTLKSDYLTQGPKVKEFEDKLCQVTGAKYAVVVSNGTAALHLAVLALGIGPGDEGITTPITFVASANCLRYVGANVRFADIESDTGLIDPIEIEKKVTSKTKVIIPVHYAGQSCDMEEIAKIAKKHKLFVIEDAAHAIGSTYKGYKVGSCKYSDLTTFSFHPVKTITTGEGGAITTNNPELYQKLLMLRTHGIIQRPDIAPWYYEMQDLGYNYRLPDILAALGISQLNQLERFSSKRKDLIKLYKKGFNDDPRFKLLTERKHNDSVFHLCPLMINFSATKTKKVELFNILKEKGLNLQVHYIPVYLQPYYIKLGFSKGDFPLAETYYESTISLPLYPDLTENDLSQIITTIKHILK